MNLGKHLSLSRPLLLGSASPRRSDILSELGLPFETAVADLDESQRSGESPVDYLDRIVFSKAEAIRRSFFKEPYGAFLVADTMVTCAGKILGKPEDEAEGLAFLRLLSGRSHEVWTRFWIEDASAHRHLETVKSEVRFRSLSEAEMQSYWASGDGAGKAGGYAIQGRARVFVEGLSGSLTNIIGLPACELLAGLVRLGLWSTSAPTLSRGASA